jgi:hypothetical protein
VEAIGQGSIFIVDGHSTAEGYTALRHGASLQLLPRNP